MNRKNIFIINNSSLEHIVGGSENSSKITKNNKSRMGMAVDSVFTVAGAIIGGCCGFSIKYSITTTTLCDQKSNKENVIQTQVTKGIQTPSIGMIGVYSTAGALLGHKVSNIITKNF